MHHAHGEAACLESGTSLACCVYSRVLGDQWQGAVDIAFIHFGDNTLDFLNDGAEHRFIVFTHILSFP